MARRGPCRGDRSRPTTSTGAWTRPAGWPPPTTWRSARLRGGRPAGAGPWRSCPGGRGPPPPRVAAPQRPSFGDADRLVEGEDGHVPERAQRPAPDRGEPALGDVLDQQQLPLPAPSEHPRSVLGEPEVVDEVQGPRAWAEQPLERRQVRSQRRIDVVEAAADARAQEGLDLRPVVVGGQEDLVAWSQAEALDAEKERLAGLAQHQAVGCRQREGRVPGRTAQVDVGRQRRPHPQPTRPHRAPTATEISVRAMSEPPNHGHVRVVAKTSSCRRLLATRATPL